MRDHDPADTDGLRGGLDLGQRPRILLSEGSSTSARQALYGLGRRYVIHVLDPSPWCQCRFSRLVNKWHRCPPIGRDPAGYLARVLELLRRERFDVLFPTHEQVFLFAKYRDQLRRYTHLAVPDFSAVAHLQSKAEFARLLAELQLPAPVTIIARSAADLASRGCFPGYLKLAHSTASLGVQLVSSPREARELLQRFAAHGAWSEGTEFVFQKPAEGRQAVVNAVFQEGRLVAAHCTTILATGIGGGPAFREGAAHAVVVEHVRRLGSHLHWHGPLALEYFYDEATGKPQYVEANPRIGETANALLSGANLCELVVRVALGRPVQPLPPGRSRVKSHTGFIVLLADAYNGASRRRLLRRLWHGWTGTDAYAGSESEMTRPGSDWGSLIPAVAASMQVLAWPRSARRLSTRTVDNYSLPQTAVATIEGLPENALSGEQDPLPARRA
jgi:predicted ATP-grasp superfamily ATP-dependent carboligase